MAVHWRLKSYLSTKKGILRPIELQKKILQRTGTLISLQNVCNYLNKKPSLINVKTIELICTALDCELKDFFEIKPSESHLKSKGQESKKLSWKNTPISKRAKDNFPDPKDYK